MHRRTLISIATFIGVAALGTAVARHHWDELVPLLSIPLPALAGLVVLMAAYWVLTGLRFRFVMLSHGVHLVFREWFGLVILTKLGSYVLPGRGGMLARATYLKRVHDFDLSRFAGSLTGLLLFNGAFNCAFGLVLLLLCRGLVVLPPRFAAALGALVLVFLAAAAAAARLSRGSPDTGFFVRRAVQAFAEVTKSRRLLAHLLWVQLLIRVTYGCGYWIAFRAVGADIPLVGTLLVSVLVALSLLVSLTPGNMGISEFVIVASSAQLGVSVAQALAAGLLLRGVEMSLVIGLGPPSSLWLSRTGRPPLAGGNHEEDTP